MFPNAKLVVGIAREISLFSGITENFMVFLLGRSERASESCPMSCMVLNRDSELSATPSEMMRSGEKMN